MNNCKYAKNEISNGIEHELCKNTELMKHNKAKEDEFHCMGASKCVKFKESNNTQMEEVK